MEEASDNNQSTNPTSSSQSQPASSTAVTPLRLPSFYTHKFREPETYEEYLKIQRHPPIPSQPNVTIAQAYIMAARARMMRIMNDWVPHPFSQEEIDDIRKETTKLRHYLLSLDARRRKLLPTVDNRLDDAVFHARVEHNTRYWRIFRIRDLPNEILANIFRLAAWSAPDPNAGIHWRLWLTWICQRFRLVTLGDPTLWNAIWFRDRPPFARSLAWFERAGSAPLDLRINDFPRQKLTREVMSDLLDVVFTKLSNIRMLIVVVEAWEPALTVLDRLRSVAEDNTPLILERFELHRTGSPYVQIGDGFHPPSFRSPMALFGGATVPSLKYFSINGVFVDWHKSVLSNLTTIDIRRIPLEKSPDLLRFRELLINSPALNKLCLDGAGPRWQPQEAYGLPPIQCDNLKILVVADFSLHYGLYVFSQLRAPNLLDLTLMNFIGEDYSQLFQLITPLFSNVRLLTFYSVECPANERAKTALVNWLLSMPQLSYLRIANVQRVFLETFIYKVVPGSKAAARLPLAERPVLPPPVFIGPNLKVIECQSIDIQLITAWLEARRNLGFPLKKIYLTRDMASKVSPKQHYAVKAICEVAYIQNGTKTAEEEALLIA